MTPRSQSKASANPVRQLSLFELPPPGEESLLGWRRYRSIIRHTPLLSPTDERALVVAMRDGDRRAKERLYLSNLRWLYHLVRWYSAALAHDRFVEDLVQAVNAMIWQHIDEFDPDMGRFSTWAHRWSLHALQRTTVQMQSPIRIPNNVWLAERRLGRLRTDYEERFGEAASDALIAEAMGVPVAGLRSLDRRTQQIPEVVYLSQTLPPGARSGGQHASVTYADVIADDRSQSDFSRGVERAELAARVRAIVQSVCDEREVAILGAIYGGPYGAATQEARKRNITRERVRQIKERALRKLRRADTDGLLRQLYEMT